MMTVLTYAFTFSFLFGISQAQAYSTIAERILSAYLSSPLDLVPSTVNSTIASDTRLNLLKWNENPQDPPPPVERYNRRQHYGEWITLNKTPSDCVDVRNRVLIRDSQTPVQMRSVNPCKVGTGRWFDPYTNTQYSHSTEVQIDHVVPLKDSYINGGWKWNYRTRCVYANYMGFRDHLKPVQGQENRLKSDHSPSYYMPPNTSYRCEYLKAWLSIKLIWKLGMQRLEAEKIRQLIAQEKCDVNEFTFSVAELQKQRKTIQEMMPICTVEPPVYSHKN